MMAENLEHFDIQARPRCGTWPRQQLLTSASGNSELEVVLPRQQQYVGTTMESANPSVPTTQNSGSDGAVMSQPPFMGMEPTGDDDYLNTLSPSAIGFIGMNPFLMDNMESSDINDNFQISSLTGERRSTSHLSDLAPVNEVPTLDESMGQATAATAPYNGSATTSEYCRSPPHTTVSTTQSSTATTSRSTPKAKSTRKNAWGNMSYADLITQAIESAPEKRLTLAQIYEWMVKNIPYFKDKGDSNSSAGWKNSIRHNLSLHAKFKRIQNEGTGKSSWWVVNHDAKAEKAPRRRAVSVDTAHAKNMNSKRQAAKRKADLLKKQKSLKSPGSASGSSSYVPVPVTGNADILGSEFRTRTTSNASYLGSYQPNTSLDPNRDRSLHRSMDSLAGNGPAVVTLPSAGNILDGSRNQNTITSASIPDFNSLSIKADPIREFSQLGQTDDNNGSGYLPIQPNMGSSRKNMESAASSPHLANLLKTELKSPLKKPQKPVPKLEPKWKMNGEFEPMIQEYQSSSALPIPNCQQYNPSMGQSVDNGQEYPFGVSRSLNDPYGQRQSMQAQVQQQEQMNFMQQPQYSGNQPQMQADPAGPMYQGQGSGMMAETPFTDFNDIDPMGLYNPGDLDNNTYNSLWNDVTHMDLEQAGQSMGYSTQPNNNYCMGNPNMTQPYQPRMHPDPDIFMNNPGPGGTSSDMMMDGGCRMKMNSSSFQHMQPGQTSSVGGSQNYNMS